MDAELTCAKRVGILMTLIGFHHLYEAADALKQRVSVAVVAAADPTVLEAVAVAADRGWISPVLMGEAPKIREIAAACDVDISRFELIDTEDASAAGVAAVRSGHAQFLMKGQIDTRTLLRSMLDKQTGLKTGRTICQVVLMEILDQHRSFLLADTGISIQPTFEQKVDILHSTVRVARALGAETPRVALMAATEKVTEAMPDTIESARLVRTAAEGMFGDCDVQGPLSFDLAYAADAGEKKRISGILCGAAEAMVFPNLLSANLTVKAIMYTANCRFGGVLCGAASPVVFMSRSDTTATRLNSLALALRIREFS